MALLIITRTPMKGGQLNSHCPGQVLIFFRWVMEEVFHHVIMICGEWTFQDLIKKRRVIPVDGPGVPMEFGIHMFLSVLLKLHFPKRISISRPATTP